MRLREQIEECRRLTDAVLERENHTGLCVHYAFGMHAMGKRLGLNIIPQAGTDNGDSVMTTECLILTLPMSGTRTASRQRRGSRAICCLRCTAGMPSSIRPLLAAAGSST